MQRPTSESKIARLLTTLALLALGLAAVPAPFAPVAAAEDAGDGAAPGVAATLRAGGRAFWDGPYIESAQISESPLMDQPMRGDAADMRCKMGETCFDYVIRVLEPGWRLRIAMDSDRLVENEFDLVVRDPQGDPHYSTWSYGGTIPPLSQEVLIPDAQPGDYVARLYVFFAEDTHTRLRAKLEHAPQAAPTVKQLLPDLRAEPPFDLGFVADGALGVTVECTPDETVEDAPQRCLRFAFGWQNIGDGTFEVRFVTGGAEDGPLSGPVVQRVYSSDGSHVDLDDAGEYEWHESHHHYHYAQFFQGELLRVIDPATGAMESVAPARKIGGCSHDWRMAQWNRFVQDPAGAQDSGLECGFAATRTQPVDARIGLSAGWHDFYAAGTPDNYADLGDAPDGEFVIRIVMDPEGKILEKDETNNVGYAHFRLEAGVIKLIERGHGTGPWDANREPLAGIT